MLTKLTPNLRALLKQYETTLSPEHFKEFTDHIEGLSRDYDAQLDSVPAGAARARKIHELMEVAMESIGNDKPSCRSGCSACCHLEVEITRDEGVLLADLVRAGHPLDKGQLAGQAKRARKAPEWAVFNTPANRCVFLGENGACTVYQDRPASCRKLLVVSHPDECSSGTGNVKAITLPMAEVLLSTVISHPDAEFMSLSKAVSAGLGLPLPTP